LIQGEYKVPKQYVSELVVKSNEVHIVDEEDFHDGIYVKAKPRERAVSMPADKVAEITAAITYLV
jgi:hypothetical protein